MNKPDFNRSTEEATKLLIAQDRITCHIDVTKLTYDKDIHFFSIQEYCKITNSPITNFISPKHKCLIDGCTYIKDGVHLVLHNDKLQTQEHLNWTRAHEIGHIYLGHLVDNDIEEIEAHFFAAQLLVPIFTVAFTNLEYRELNHADIMKIFGVSREAAIKRKKTMDNFSFLGPSSEDWNIWGKQKVFIDQYFNSQPPTRDVCVLNM